MPKRPPLTRRLATAAAFPAGLALTSWNYMWRTTPMHRREESGTAQEDAPPPLPAHVRAAELQCPEEGVGPLFHRSYRTRIREARLSAEPLLRLIDRFEAIAERRATRRALYAMSDIALADIGLTQADLSRSDPDCSWMSLITPQQRP